jgi:hypothetical protein
MRMKVVTQDFGIECKQISINDCYGGYNRFKNQQICWVHIIREAESHSLKENTISTEKKFYKKLKTIYKSAMEFVENPHFDDVIKNKKNILRINYVI